MRDSFIFYRSFAEAISSLSNRERLKLFDALVAYALDDKDPELTGAAYGMFTLIKPQVDANNRKYENGKRGGRPSQNQDETKPKPNDNQDITKTQPNVNVNGNGNISMTNVNSNENENVSTDVDVWSLSRSVLSYLNEKAGTAYRVDDAKHVKLISQLAHQGYTEGQMKDVIDKKVEDWLGDPKVEQYLRPSTLFGPKFEQYLQQPDTARQQKQLEDEEEQRQLEEDLRKMRETHEREMAKLKEDHDRFMREHGLKS